MAPPETTETKTTSSPGTPDTKRGWRFWLIFLALCLSLFLTALDLASVYTALPSIIHDLQGAESFVWVGSAYTLSCSAVLPLSGRLADIFGRRIILLVSIVLFAVGSTVTAVAHTMGTIIIGRSSGAIQVLVAIVTADLIPLKDRGLFQSITGATFSFASAAGPFIAGALAQHATWRWLFYLNLPLCAIAFVVVFLFLHLRKPPVESYKHAFLSLDWIGNTLIIAGAASCIIGLTWAGIQHPWSSAQVIAPLVIGIAGLVGAVLYDAYVASHPVVRTTLGGYIGSFFHILIISSMTFYLSVISLPHAYAILTYRPLPCSPTYFQAAKLAPPLLSGLYIFPSAICISPAAIVQGILVSKTGLLTLLKPGTPVAVTIPFQAIAAIGFGFVYATTFSVLAPLPPTHNAAALSFLLFMRTFSSAWASSISGTIFQNRLHSLLPAEFLARLPPDQDVTYSGIPLIPSLEQPLQNEVRAAFANSIRLVWYICLGLCAVGFVSVAMQEYVPLHTKMDDRFGMKEKRQSRVQEVELGESKNLGVKPAALADGEAPVLLKESEEAPDSQVHIQEIAELPSNIADVA
ncbi:hypothetical protein BN946_scf185006.g17 [Trametes cinnabarina]|uniref:Major facilitator superfamily (MFS) profile domain-containing protein n=1 Tax=Pycnoporus cinnabarinus TaxID=5643 RepID=A0A060SRE2_PYCCI|nr:hypothetical protein BN946_scf185006.g17 [Trametes cinnabarina]